MKNSSIVENNIGKVLHFDEPGFVHSKIVWERKLLPTISKIISTYQSLNIGQFDQNVFDDLIVNGVKNVKEKCQALVKSDFSSFQSPVAVSSALGSIDNLLAPLSQLLQNLHNEKREASSGISPLDLPWSDVRIIKGAPELDLKAIRKRFETTIETEEQNELYGKLLALKDQWNSVLGFVKDRGYDISRLPFFGPQGFVFQPDSTEELEINELSINFL